MEELTHLKHIENPTADETLQFRFAAYLNVAFRNCRIGHWRKWVKTKTISTDDERADPKILSMYDKPLEYDLLEVSDNPTIIGVIKNLDDNERKILSMHVIERYTFVEISRLMSMDYADVIRIFSKIKRKFRRGFLNEF
jgi:DNA-directed RNA polymerase specialized sigma24 family protein